MADEESKLLFFDTFSHDNTEELNLDLVQFQQPVLVTEIRVIPLNTKVEANVPGGVRLGATRPSKISLKFFVNNLNNSNPVTFETLGKLDYLENVDIQFVADQRIPTDGLILYGQYSTITVAVYGEPTVVKPRVASPPPPPPPQPAHSVMEAVATAPSDNSQVSDYQVSSQVKTAASNWDTAGFGSPPRHPQSMVEHSPQTQERTPPAMPQPQPPRQAHVLDILTNPDLASLMPSALDTLQETLKNVSESRDRDYARDRDRDDYDDHRRDREWDRDRERDRDHRDYRYRDRSPSSDVDYRDQRSREGSREPYRDRDYRDSRDSRDSRDKGRDRDHRRDRDSRDSKERGRPRSPIRNRRSRSPMERRRSRTRTRSRSPMSRSSSRSKDPHIMHPVAPPQPPAPPEPDPEPVHAGEIEEAPEEAMYPDPVETEPAIEEGIYPGTLSEGELQEPDPEQEILEDISSDELSDELPAVVPGVEWDDMEEIWSTVSPPPFNPYNFEASPLETYVDPALTAYEAEKQKLIFAKEEEPMPESAKQILNIVNAYKEEKHHSRWIEALESIPGLAVPGLVYLVTKTDHKEMLETLVDWSFEGLDINKAMAQPETAFKVRHLKMGIRLAALLCSADSYVAHRMLTGNVQQKLLDLMVAPHMSSSLKLMIIRTLDCTTRLKDGIDWFLGRHTVQLEAASSGTTDADDNSNHGDEKAAMTTGYQQLISIMLQKQMVRVMACLKALVRKIHVYELLMKFSLTVEQMAENSPPITEPREPPATVAEGEEVTMETEVMIDSISEDEAEVIEGCLEEALRILVHAELLIAQPKRTLPAQVKFCITQRPYDPYPNLYHIFNSCRLLETLFVLVSSPVTCSHVGIFCGIRDLVHQLLTAHSGLLYLGSRPETINGIIRALTQNANDGQEDAGEENPAQQLGLQMVYPLQVLQLLDQLRLQHSKEAVMRLVDDEAVLTSLHSLYALAEVMLGREALVNVMSLEDNLKVLLPFLDLTGIDEEKAVEIKKSVTVGYVILLLHLVIKQSTSADMLLKFGPHILNALDEDFSGCKMSDRVTELQDWLAMFRKLTIIDVDHLDELIKQLKQYNEDMREMPKGLVTVLRVIQHLAIAPPQQLAEDGLTELKYKYVLVELVGSDCFPVFVNIVQKVGEQMLRSWQHGLPQSYNQGSLLLALVRPALALIKAILCQLIHARGVEFRDVTSLSCLFLIYTVCCSAPMTVTLTADAQCIQNDVVETLMAFTQPGIKDEEAADALSTSLWTMMMRELLNFIPTAPYTFLGGLMLVSELVPLPLPLQTREILSEDEVAMAVNHRKLWSAHLHPLQSELHAIIMQLTGSSCQPFQQVLRRVYIQIADLAAPSALIIVRGVLDALLESMDATIERLHPEPAPDAAGHEEGVGHREELRSSGHTSRILNLLAYVMNQPPIKATFLYLCRQTTKPDDKYHDMLQRLVQLLNVISEKPSHVQAQEAIVSIFQSLCDVEVTLISSENTTMTFDDQLANSLPNREHLSLICNGLLEHIGNRDHNLSSVLPSLRTLTLLLDHDYGFYHLTQAVKAHPDVLVNLFMRINTTFSKDSSDCIATLSSAAELLQFMVTLPDAAATPVEEGVPPVSAERKLMLTNSEVREMLGWTSDGAGHPLDDLEKLLQEYAKEEETLRAVLDSVASVSTILKTDDDPSAKRPELVEPLTGTVETLSSQFSQRLVYVLIDADEEDRVSATYWLPMPTAEESDQEIELVRCDFEEIIEKCCPEFDLKAELAKGTDQEEKSVAVPRRKLRANRPSQDTINTSRMRGNNRGFVAPMRGRGFGRGMNNMSRHDPFRSRPPNTSRPPSMHVDDFVKMENQQGHGAPQQSAPPEGGRGGGAGGRRPDKDNNRGGRGGRGGFNSRRGGGGNSFFNNSPNNGRRENMGTQSRGGLYGSRGRGTGTRGGARGGGAPRSMQPNKQSITPKNTNPWLTRSPRQSFSGGRMMPRGGGGHSDQRLQTERRGMREQGNSGRFTGQRGGGRGGHFSNREQDRYGSSSGMGRFQGGRDRGRHQRSFTK